MMLCRVTHAEYDRHLGVKTGSAQGTKIGHYVERQPVDAWLQATIVRKQRFKSAIVVCVALPDRTPGPRRSLQYQHHRNPARGKSGGYVQHMEDDVVHALIVRKKSISNRIVEEALERFNVRRGLAVNRTIMYVATVAREATGPAILWPKSSRIYWHWPAAVLLNGSLCCCSRRRFSPRVDVPPAQGISAPLLAV